MRYDDMRATLLDMENHLAVDISHLSQLEVRRSINSAITCLLNAEAFLGLAERNREVGG